MGSVSDSFQPTTPSRPTCRRYSSMHSRLQQRWRKSRNIENSHPSVQNQTHTQLIRNPLPTFDLAQQAQLAACDYLGYHPRDLPNSFYSQQGAQCDVSRPMELHMHHHHHHYVAAPTSAFSPHRASEYLEGRVSEAPGAANELAIRVPSPAAGIAASTARTTTTTTSYGTLGLRQTLRSSCGGGFKPQKKIHRLQDSSDSQQQRKSLGDEEAAQRYIHNVLWLKNQIEGNRIQPNRNGLPDAGWETVGSEEGIVKERQLGSVKTDLRPVASEQNLILLQNNNSCSRAEQAGDDPKDSASEVEGVFNLKRKPKAESVGANLLLNGNKATRKFQNYKSPYNSTSEENSVTDSSASTVVVRDKRNFGVPTDAREVELTKNGEAAVNGATSGSQGPRAPDAGCSRFLSWPQSTRRDAPKPLGRAENNNLCDDTSSSVDDNDSICSSGTGSLRRKTWTCNSSLTNGENRRNGPSFLGRLMPTCRGDTRSRAQLLKELEKSPEPKSSYFQKAKPEDREESECVYEMHSDPPVEATDFRDREGSVLEERQPSSLLRTPREQAREREFSKAHIFAAYGDISRATSSGPNRDGEDDASSDGLEKPDPSRLTIGSQQDADPSTSALPTPNEDVARDRSPQNRLREAVEAAWQTNLGTKNCFNAHNPVRSVSDPKALPDLKPEDANQDVGILKYHQVSDNGRGKNLRESHVGRSVGAQNEKAREAKVETFEEAWKANLGRKNGVEIDYLGKGPVDPVFWEIHQDHQNLKALVAREESLHKELKDQTLARVAAEEKARIVAERKAQIYAASAKAAEEGLRVLLDERAVFHSKFKEELEKGASDRLRLQEMLQSEKQRLESTEDELREVRSYQGSLAGGTKALPDTNLLQEPKLDVLSVNAFAPHGIGAGHDEARWQLIAESERRIATEAKASYFEASAKAAESRLRSLLDERNWFYLRYKEELERNNTDMIKLRKLMELDKAGDGASIPIQKVTRDVGSSDGASIPTQKVTRDVGSSDEDLQNLAITSEDDHVGPPPGEPCRAPCASLSCFPLSFGKHDKLAPSQDITAEPPLKLQLSNEEQKPHIEETTASDPCNSPICAPENEKSGEEFKEKWTPCLHGQRCSNGGTAPETSDTGPETSALNIDKESQSLGDSVRVCHWDSPNVPFSVTVAQRNEGSGETATVLDISPGNAELKSMDLTFSQPMDYPDCMPEELAFDTGQTMEATVETVDTQQTSNLAKASLTNSSQADNEQRITVTSKWKKETKAELRRMIHEQELTWKIAEDAVDELSRRLELLEGYKIEIQDTIRRSRAVGSMGYFLNRLEQKFEYLPGGFNLLYDSPIFDGQLSICSSPNSEDKDIRVCSNGKPAHHALISSDQPNEVRDCQTQQLKVEIAHLKKELDRREKKTGNSAKTKSHSQSLPPLRPSSVAPTSSMSVVSNCSALSMPNFEGSTEEADDPTLNDVCEDDMVFAKLTVKELEMEIELPDDPFEDMTTITKQALTETERTEYPGVIKDVDLFDHTVGACLTTEALDTKSRSHVPTPDGELLEKSAGPACKDLSMDCTSKEADKCNGCIIYDNSAAGDLDSDQGELQLLKAAVYKLSQIFWEQGGKLETMRCAANVGENESSQTTDLRLLYLEILKGMSQQLGELCRDLHANFRAEEKPVQKCQCMEKPYQTSGAVFSKTTLEAEPRITEGNAHLFLSGKLESGAEELFKVVKDQVDDISSESVNLKTALKAAEKNMEVQMSANQILSERMEIEAQQLSRVQAEHAEEMTRKDQIILKEKELNVQLANDMCQTQSSLSELRTRYKDLVSNLEDQLEAARREAVKLQNSATELKVEIGRKEDLIVRLQEDAQKQKVQISAMKEKIEASQKEVNMITQKKIELIENLNARRKDVKEKHNHVCELISINEDLISFSQCKEDEVKELTETVKNLEQTVQAKSEEATKASADALKFSQEVVDARKEGEVYRLRCTALKSKLEETEQELLAREESTERLTQHLAKTIEGQDTILEEKEHILLSLNKAQYKEHRMDDQVRQSKIIIQELEEKLNSMDADINKARLEMADIKAKGQKVLAIERHAGEMTNRVFQLEEEVMEKEGQISILKTSFPGEYASTF